MTRTPAPGVTLPTQSRQRRWHSQPIRHRRTAAVAGSKAGRACACACDGAGAAAGRQRPDRRGGLLRGRRGGHDRCSRSRRGCAVQSSGSSRSGRPDGTCAVGVRHLRRKRPAGGGSVPESTGAATDDASAACLSLSCSARPSRAFLRASCCPSDFCPRFGICRVQASWTRKCSQSDC
jgi:hypothetical protein